VLGPILFFTLLAVLRLSLVGDNKTTPERAYCSLPVSPYDTHRDRSSEHTEKPAAGAEEEGEEVVPACQNDDLRAASWDSSSRHRHVAYTPDTPEARAVMGVVGETMALVLGPNVTYTAMTSEDDVDNIVHAASGVDAPRYRLAVVFKDDAAGSKSTDLWSTATAASATCNSTGPACSPKVHFELRFPQEAINWMYEGKKAFMTGHTFVPFEQAKVDLYVSRAVQFHPPCWPIRFRLALRTYAPCIVRVVSQTKPRKIPTRNHYRSMSRSGT